MQDIDGLVKENISLKKSQNMDISYINQTKERIAG